MFCRPNFRFYYSITLGRDNLIIYTKSRQRILEVQNSRPKLPFWCNLQLIFSSIVTFLHQLTEFYWEMSWLRLREIELIFCWIKLLSSTSQAYNPHLSSTVGNIVLSLLSTLIHLSFTLNGLNFETRIETLDGGFRHQQHHYIPLQLSVTLTSLDNT